MNNLWQILDIKCQDRRTNKIRSDITIIEAAILKNGLSYSEYITLMASERLLYNNLVNNKRHSGASKRKFKDKLKSSRWKQTQHQGQRSRRPSTLTWSNSLRLFHF